MEINNTEQLKSLKDNIIIGTPNLINSKIVFKGKKYIIL